MTAHATFLHAAPVASDVGETAGERQRASASSWFALGVLILVMVLSLIDKLIFTLVAEPLRHSLAVSDTQLGLLQGVGFTLASGLAMLPCGWLGDRFDRRWVLAISIVLWSVAGGLRGVSDGFSMLFFATVGLGIAEGSPMPINNSLIPDLFPRSQRVIANTIYGLVTLLAASLGAWAGGQAVTLAEMARPHLPAAMQHMETWRLAFFATAAAGLPIALLVLLIPRLERGRYDAHTAAAQEASRQEFGDYLRAHWRTIAGVVCGTGFTMVAFSAVGSWIPIMVARRFGATPQQLGQGIAVSFFLATLAGTALAILGMKIVRPRMGPAGTLRLLTLGNLAFTATAPLLIFVRSSFDVFCVLGLIVTPLIANVLVSPNAVQDMAPGPLRSRTVGVMSMAGMLFQVIGPLAIGNLSDRLNAVSPNALAIALVLLTVVMGAIGSVVLRATEASFSRMVATIVGRAEK